MKHLISHKEVDIEWEQDFIIDNHGSGCVDWAIKGEDVDGVRYTACGHYQSGELIDVSDIELE